jgi:hypothetical protein
MCLQQPLLLRVAGDLAIVLAYTLIQVALLRTAFVGLAGLQIT